MTIRACSVNCTDAGDAPAVSRQVLQRYAFAHLGAGSHGGIDQQLVEDRAAGTVHRVRAAGLLWRHEGQVAEPKRDLRDRGTAGGAQGVEKSPAREPVDAVALDEVGGHDVAREGVAVEHQHLVALAGQEHGCRRTGAARADDDGVVHGASSLV
jgi:hypothetical protein